MKTTCSFVISSVDIPSITVGVFDLAAFLPFPFFPFPFFLGGFKNHNILLSIIKYNIIHQVVECILYYTIYVMVS